MKIIENFSGTSIGNYRIENNVIFAKLREEKITRADGYSHDYNYHFAFGIKNEAQKPTDVEVFINCDSTYGLSNQSALIFQAKSPKEEFAKFTGSSKTDTHKKYYFKFQIGANETAYIANYYFRQYEILVGNFERLAAKGNAEREVFGHTIEGRDLICYSYKGNNNSNTPSILITSGFHFPEQDTLATEAIMKFLSNGENRERYNQFNFYIIPIVNPDGFVHGYNGCNAKGINLYWDFREYDKSNTPETYHLWQYILNIKPCLYIDFHSYTFQMHRKKASPYIKPLYFYNGREVRNLVKQINKELISLHDGYYSSGDLTYAPSTLSYKLTNKFNTITYAKYHLHIMDGKEEFESKAINIIKRICHCFVINNFLNKDKILIYPHGQVRNHNIWDILRKKLTIFWAFRMKVFVKKFLPKI